MKQHIRLLSFLGILMFTIVLTAFGRIDDKPPQVPQLIRTLLKKEGSTLEDLKTDPTLREKLRQQLYQKLGKPAPKRRMTPRMLHRAFVKLPPYCQVIVDNNLFRPLGYQKYQWTLKLELIGTMVYADSAKNTAILKSNHPKYRRLIVQTGDTFLEELIMTQIEARRIIYTDKDGKEKHLDLRTLFGGDIEKPEMEEKL